MGWLSFLKKIICLTTLMLLNYFFLSITQFSILTAVLSQKNIKPQKSELCKTLTRPYQLYISKCCCDGFCAIINFLSDLCDILSAFFLQQSELRPSRELWFSHLFILLIAKKHFLSASKLIPQVVCKCKK